MMNGRILFRFFMVIITVVSLSALSGTGSFCQENWYPSKWGAGDELGAGNLLSPQNVIEAAKLITEGKIYELGKIYDMNMPVFGSRHYSLIIPQTFGPMGENNMTWHEEIISGELGQIGTQFDALGHVGIGDLYYNGFDRKDFAKPYGLEKLGVDKAPVFFTRGVLLDAAGVKGVKHLEKGYEITAEDLKKAIDMAGVQINKGDVVIINTGWGSLFNVDAEMFNSGQPGLGLEGAQFLIDHDIVMIGSDNWGIEVVPNPDPNAAFPVHQLVLAKNGVYLIENLDLSELVEDKVYEFCFSYAPLKLRGATGSPGNPIAIK